MCYVGLVIDVVPSMIKIIVLFSYLLYEKYNVTFSVVQVCIASGYYGDAGKGWGFLRL